MKIGQKTLFIVCCCLCIASLIAYTLNLNKISVYHGDKFMFRVGTGSSSTTSTSQKSKDNFGKLNVTMSSFKTPTNITIKVNVPKMCEKICDRDLLTCFNPSVAIVVYDNSSPDRMTFKQSFSSFPVIINTTEGGKNETHVWSQKRKYCPVTDLDPSFQTVRMQNSCAIIGNSGILLNSSCGTEINSYDFVLRANLAKLEGYTEDVGNKTSLMFINGESLRNLYSKLFAKRTSEQSKSNFEDSINYTRTLNDGIIWFGKSTRARGYAGKLAKIAKFLRERMKVRFGFSMYNVGQPTSRRWKTKGYPTSGLMMLTIAESFCKNITLYGFYPYQNDSTGSRILHHYYEPNLLDFHTDNHDFEEEHQLLRSLHQNGSLRLILTPCKKRF
ncbi:Alpha-2,8-sialyltransferase 8B [Holothuria leucospilota]|uniref:Alpha-2,8-sialyltransferase 8B n=1 Tax=Holothuria leucospilota TaxID=206669 RepID=A0A9Q1CME7_HOLLE|nr:Alpha-2,8-sialyltransferase 8B [Holothuria leucospilota]